MSKCSGCGIEIQNQNQDKAGYIPFSVMTERMAAGDEVLCQRCYRIKHYNKFLPVGMGTDFYQKLEDILQTFNTIVWVIDIIDFEGTFRTDIALKLKNKNLIIAVNKADLLPNAVKYEEIKEWVCDRVSQVIRVKRDNIRIISTRSGFGINRLSKMISEINDTKVAVIGVTNVGKSSVLNEITDAGVTVSSYPGTTLNFIKTRLKDSNIELYDT
ncbi:MAG TPA: 50S ribosome-binding GTPase, partial [Petrotogaceae bacterium]|nr:50S ribosome-binding GTPase [Petrotogaceae bacterium]